ncbi:hypothetical protein ACIRPT_27055 [Streptomyces sp. NPDC101227]|uniref:hypothetical protein n=1 Tax=Streptomyces sp. NPDC101227 TaxID=3366136 RepID=UPI0037FEBAD8
MSDPSTDNTPTAPQADPTTATSPTLQGNAPTSPTTPAAPQGEDAAVTIARLVSDLSAARAEAGKSRVTAKQKAADDAVQQHTQNIGKALGLITDDEQVTPERLTQQLTAAQAQARQTAVELAVYRHAAAAGGDADALLDSRTFAASLDGLGPTDTADIQAAIEAAATANPKLAAAPSGLARGGAEFTGPPAANQRPKTLHDAVAAHLGG